MLFNILALFSVISIMTLLKRLVHIFPSLAAGMFRWKENAKFEASAKNIFDRNIIAVSMVIPFCLVADKFEMYRPAFMEGMGENLRTACVLGVFVIYLIVRLLASMVAGLGKASRKTYEAAGSVPYNFFIILTITLILTGGILSFADAAPEVIKNVMLWVSVSAYAWMLLIKCHIFASDCSIFTAFLYLCALEIIPTGLLAASAMIL